MSRSTFCSEIMSSAGQSPPEILRFDERARDVHQTRTAAAFFVLACAVYLAVTVAVLAELWESVVAVIGAGPIAVVLGFVAIVAGSLTIRATVKLTNECEGS